MFSHSAMQRSGNENIIFDSLSKSDMSFVVLFLSINNKSVKKKKGFLIAFEL